MPTMSSKQLIQPHSHDLTTILGLKETQDNHRIDSRNGINFNRNILFNNKTYSYTRSDNLFDDMSILQNQIQDIQESRASTTEFGLIRIKSGGGLIIEGGELCADTQTVQENLVSGINIKSLNNISLLVDNTEETNISFVTINGQSLITSLGSEQDISLVPKSEFQTEVTRLDYSILEKYQDQANRIDNVVDILDDQMYTISSIQSSIAEIQRSIGILGIQRASGSDTSSGGGGGSSQPGSPQIREHMVAYLCSPGQTSISYLQDSGQLLSQYMLSMCLINKFNISSNNIYIGSNKGSSYLRGRFGTDTGSASGQTSQSTWDESSNTHDWSRIPYGYDLFFYSFCGKNKTEITTMFSKTKTTIDQSFNILTQNIVSRSENRVFMIFDCGYDLEQDQSKQFIKKDGIQDLSIPNLEGSNKQILIWYSTANTSDDISNVTGTFNLKYGNDLTYNLLEVLGEQNKLYNSLTYRDAFDVVSSLAPNMKKINLNKFNENALLFS